MVASVPLISVTTIVATVEAGVEEEPVAIFSAGLAEEVLVDFETVFVCGIKFALELIPRVEVDVMSELILNFKVSVVVLATSGIDLLVLAEFDIWRTFPDELEIEALIELTDVVGVDIVVIAGVEIPTAVEE